MLLFTKFMIIKFSGLVDRRNINFHPSEFSIFYPKGFALGIKYTKFLGVKIYVSSINQSGKFYIIDFLCEILPTRSSLLYAIPESNPVLWIWRQRHWGNLAKDCCFVDSSTASISTNLCRRDSRVIEQPIL